MNLREEDLRFAFSRAEQISDVYIHQVLGGDSDFKSVDELLLICRDYLDKRIEVEEQDGKARTARSAYIAYPDKFVITEYANQPLDWRRFARSKDLFHIILHSDRSEIDLNLYDHGLEYVSAVQGNSTAPPSDSVAFEELAEIAAMEFFLPFCRRTRLIEQQTRSIEDIGKTFGIPQFFISKYFQCSMMKQLEAVSRKNCFC